MTDLELYENLLRYACGTECPIEDKDKVIEGASEILNAHFKSWADSQPDPFAYDVVKKESVLFMDIRSLIEKSKRAKTIRKKYRKKKYRVA